MLLYTHCVKAYFTRSRCPLFCSCRCWLAGENDEFAPWRTSLWHNIRDGGDGVRVGTRAQFVLFRHFAIGKRQFITKFDMIRLERCAAPPNAWQTSLIMTRTTKIWRTRGMVTHVQSHSSSIDHRTIFLVMMRVTSRSPKKSHSSSTASMTLPLYFRACATGHVHSCRRLLSTHFVPGTLTARRSAST
jgi:hypothetical protein